MAVVKCPVQNMGPCQTPEACWGGHCVRWTDPAPIDLRAAAREQELPDLLKRARVLLKGRDQTIREVALLRVINWFLDGL